MKLYLQICNWSNYVQNTIILGSDELKKINIKFGLHSKSSIFNCDDQNAQFLMKDKFDDILLYGWQMANMRWNINAFLEVHSSSLSFLFFSSVGTDNEDLKLLQMWAKVFFIIKMTSCWELSAILNKSFSSKTDCATD